MRSLGILKTAYIMSHKEAVNLLSNVRFGISTGLIDNINIETINDLLVEIQPATLMTILGEQITVKDRDISRAEYIRNKLN